MIIGDYDIINYTYNNCKIVQPPKKTDCEKNWIPIIKDNQEYFIYKWSPFQYGKINPDNNQLEIIYSYEINSPEFDRIRGSTVFINDDNNEFLIGVVHFSEEFFPRQYFHMLVQLDKETLQPIYFSEPFCFQHYGVEFCIGFTIKDDKYIFWISKMDNDAIMVTIDKKEIPIVNTVN
jgi:hypothetical protein